MRNPARPRGVASPGTLHLLVRRGRGLPKPPDPLALLGVVHPRECPSRKDPARVIRVPHPINHPKFVAAALSAFHEIVGRAS